jgi:phenylalanyl-tRNA synthetase beta chain
MLKISNLQPVTREFAFIINKEIESEKVCQVAKSINKDLITDVIILDIYNGDKIPQDMKSVAIKVTIQPIQETLTDSALEEISANLINAIEKKLSGSLREI